MKIAIDASKANTQKKTGTEWYSYNLIKNISEVEHDHQYILYIREKPQNWVKKLPVNYKYKLLAWPPKFLWSQLRFSFEMLISKPDLLFVPAHTIPLIHPKNTVTTLHDVGFERYPELYATKKIGPKIRIFAVIVNIIIRIFTLGKYGSSELDYHRYSMKLAVEKAKKIITPSEFTKREIIEFYRCLPEKIVVIPHGYDRTVYRPIDDNSKITEILNKYKIKQPYLLFIGRLERKKNILGLINAFGILKNKYKIKSKLVLVGFPGYGYQEAEDRIRELGIEKEIIQTGWLDIKDMPYIICGADLFIFPTFYEGFGLPVLEVMACGIPVAASKIPVIEEIAGDAAYYYNPFSPEQIAETVFKLINDSRLRESLIRKGMERAKLFSWKKSAKMTIELLKTFLKSV